MIKIIDMYIPVQMQEELKELTINPALKSSLEKSERTLITFQPGIILHGPHHCLCALGFILWAFFFFFFFYESLHVVCSWLVLSLCLLVLSVCGNFFRNIQKHQTDKKGEKTRYGEWSQDSVTLESNVSRPISHGCCCLLTSASWQLYDPA